MMSISVVLMSKKVIKKLKKNLKKKKSKKAICSTQNTHFSGVLGEVVGK